MKVQTYKVAHFSLQTLLAYAESFKRIVDDQLPSGRWSLARELNETYDALNKQRAKADAQFASIIEEADRMTDRAWYGLYHQAQASAFHFNEQTCEAGERVREAIERIGNPTYLSYQTEYDQLNQLLTALHEIPEETIAKAACSYWVAELERRWNLFLDLRKEKNVAKAMVESGLMKKLRVAYETAYRNFVDQLNAMLLLGDAEDLEHLAKALNALIDEHRALQKADRTRKQKAGEREE